MKIIKLLKNGFIAASIFFMSVGHLNAEPIIADHHAVAEFDQYKDDPDFQNAIVTAKSIFHLGYGHTSHGSQITSGMTGFNAFFNNLGYPTNLFSWNNGGSGGALDLEEGDGYGNGWLDHDCGYSGWDDETRYYLDSNDPDEPYEEHSDVNIIMWSWCGQVDTVNIQTHYLDNMADLETEYPDVTFIYMTGHLEGQQTGNIWFNNNNAIRNWASTSTDRVLFDFADIEKYDPDQLVNYADYFADDNCDYDSDGAEPRNEDSNWATAWQNSHTQNIDWYSVSCAHSQSLNCNQKAKAFWWMMARMAGWNSSMAPLVTTGVASAVTVTSVTLNGIVNPNGASTTAVFEYGTSTSYGSTVAATQNPITGTSSKAVSGGIIGLSPDITYHFRVKATNSAGTTNGNDQTFATSATTPTVTTTAISSVTSNSASSGGNVTSYGGASITARGACWSTSANPTVSNSKTTDGTGTGSFTSSITGLSSDTLYYVRAYATNSQGTVYGSDISFTTLSLPLCPDCASSPVVLAGDIIFGSDTNCECSDATSITIGPGVTIETGANIIFKAPTVTVKPGFRAKPGSSVKIKQGS